MKIISFGKYQCPHCGTVFQPDKRDVGSWWSIRYCDCPYCEKTLHLAGTRFDRWLAPYDIEGKRAIKVEG